MNCIRHDELEPVAMAEHAPRPMDTVCSLRGGRGGCERTQAPGSHRPSGTSCRPGDTSPGL